MASAVSYPHVEKLAGQSARLSRVPRVRVSQIAFDYASRGWSPEEIVRQYPHLRLAEVYSAIAYYLDHSQEIDDELAADATVVAEARKKADLYPPSVIQRLKAAKAGGENPSSSR